MSEKYTYNLKMCTIEAVPICLFSIQGHERKILNNQIQYCPLSSKFYISELNLRLWWQVNYVLPISLRNVAFKFLIKRERVFAE